MLYDFYASYIVISSQETELKKHKYKWFKSRLILVTGESFFHIVLWEKEKDFLLTR